MPIKSFDKRDRDWQLALTAAPAVGCSAAQAVKWIRTGTSPRNQLVAKAWVRALASARSKLDKMNARRCSRRALGLDQPATASPVAASNA